MHKETTSVAPIRFGGVPKAPKPEVFAAARKGNSPWFAIWEKAYASVAAAPENEGRYADPKGDGATLEQIWRLFTLFGVESYCYLARSMPDDQLREIPRMVKNSPENLIAKLKRIQEQDGQLNVTTLHYDGETGHCIRLTAFDAVRDRFVYHDPWPERSLLCLENNEAGVDAQPEGGRWSVTTAELARVVFACFVFPHQHARLNDVCFDLPLSQWVEGPFFSFFHLQRLREESQGGIKRQLFTAGPFKDAVALLVDSNLGGRITRATLSVKRTWITANLPLALDLAKSFIIAFAPPPERAAYSEIAGALWNLRQREFLEALRQPDPSASGAGQVARVLVGAMGSAVVQTDLATLAIENVALENEAWLDLGLTLP